jgi:hypothetical protein
MGKLFTEIQPVEASSLPHSGEELQKHIDEIIAAAKEVIESTPNWKSKGHYHHQTVEVRERMDWRGKRNWFLRRSVHKDVSFEVFRVETLLVWNANQ